MRDGGMEERQGGRNGGRERRLNSSTGDRCFAHGGGVASPIDTPRFGRRIYCRFGFGTHFVGHCSRKKHMRFLL